MSRTERQQLKERLRERLRRFFLGDDIFVSYSRKDGLNYAQALAAQLTKRGFLRFIDLLGTDPDERVPESLKSKVRRSTVFILVATEGAALSSAVSEEVAEFAKTKRPIIPIDINGALKHARYEPLVRGLAQTEETDPTHPSDQVMSRIENSFKYTRRNQTLRKVFLGTVVGIFALILSGIVVTHVIARQATEANNRRSAAEERTRLAEERLKEAETKALEAEEQAVAAATRADAAASREEDATRRAKSAERLRAAAETKAGAAERRRLVAEDRRSEADRLAAAARAEAERQQQVNAAQRLANEAELVLKHQPDQLPRSIYLAADSLSQFDSLGIRSLDADVALREGLMLMPRLKRAVDLGESDKLSSARTPDGRYLALASGKRVRVLDTTKDWSVEITLDYPNNGVGNIWLTLSANGRFLATRYTDPASSSALLQVWDVATGKAVTPPWKPIRIEDLSFEFSPDGRYLAVTDGTVTQVYETLTGREVSPPLRSATTPYVMKFSPDGKYLATTGHDKSVAIWDWKNVSGRPAALLEHDARLGDIIFDNSGRYLATKCENYTVRVWDWAADAGRPITPPMKFDGHVHFLSFSPKSRYFAATSWGNARVLEIAKRDAYNELANTFSVAGSRKPSRTSTEEVLRLNPGGFINSIAFSGDENYLATGRYGKMASVWEITTGREVVRVPGYPSVGDVFFRPDDARRLAIRSDNLLREWEVGGVQPAARAEHTSWISALAFSPNGRYFATATPYYDSRGKAHVYVWEVQSGHRVNDIEFVALSGDKKSNYSPSELKFSPDGRYLVIASTVQGNSVRAGACIWAEWDTPHPREIACIDNESGVNALAFSNNGEYLAIAGNDGFARIWEDWDTHHPLLLAEINHEKLPRPLLAETSQEKIVSEVTFSSDGSYIATVSGNVARVWEWRNNVAQPLVTLGDQSPYRSVAFSQNGKYITTVVAHVAVVWDWKTDGGRVVARLRHDGSGVERVGFTPDGQYLYTGGMDSTIRLWEAWETASPREVTRLRADQSQHNIAFSGDGKYLGTVPVGYHHILMWLWRPKDLLAEACSALKGTIVVENWFQVPWEEYIKFSNLSICQRFK